MTKPSKFTLVRQPAGSRICSACVVAMATGHPLEQVMASMTPTNLPDGTFYYKMCEVFKYLGSYSVLCGSWFTTYDNTKPSRGIDRIELNVTLDSIRALMVVKSSTFIHTLHFVFWDGNKIYDSLYDELRDIEEYRIIEIYPLTYFEENEWSAEDLLKTENA